MIVPKILVADDEPDILEFLKYNLEKSGFVVFTANGGINALKLATSKKPNIILLDIMMPDKDGIEVCRELRSRPEFENTIIILFTAMMEEYSQIAAFDVGADDFVNKPIKVKVLVARINSLLKRRTRFVSNTNVLAFNTIIIDTEKRVIVADGEPFELPKKEYDILLLLTSKPGKVFSRDEILDKIWGKGVFVSNKTIDVHIRRIREKIGNDPIKTCKGIGYKFSD